VQQRRAPPPRDAAALQLSRRAIDRFFWFPTKETDNSYGVRLHGARHRAGGGGSTLLYTLHHLPRPTPLFPHSNEARCTHAYLEL